MENKIVIHSNSPKGKDDYHTFSVRIKKELVKKLDDICIQSGYSRNKLIGFFLEYAVEHYEIEEKK